MFQIICAIILSTVCQLACRLFCRQIDFSLLHLFKKKLHFGVIKKQDAVGNFYGLFCIIEKFSKISIFFLITSHFFLISLRIIAMASKLLSNEM